MYYVVGAMSNFIYSVLDFGIAVGSCSTSEDERRVGVLNAIL